MIQASFRRGKIREKGGTKKREIYIKHQSFSRVHESLWKMKWLILGIGFPFEKDKRYWHVWMEETEGRLHARSWDSCLELCEPSESFYIDY